MNEYVAKITLDLNCQATPVVISAGQFDIGRKIQITLTADGEAYDATGATAVCKGKNNNNYFAVNATVAKNIVTVTTDKAMLSSAGRTVAKIVLTDGTRTYSTQPFVINTHSDYDGDITTSDYYPELLDILSRVLALTESGAVLTDTKLSATSVNPLQNKVLTPIINTINNRLQSAEQYLYSKANATDVANALKSKEDKLNKVSSKADITDRNTNYPSIEYLGEYYYDANESYSSAETDELLGNKADKATTLAGYGITDAYTKTEVDDSLKEFKDDICVGYDGTKYSTAGKAVRNQIVELKSDIGQLSEEMENLQDNGSGLTSTEKALILTLFKNAAYISDGMADAVASLETAFNNNSSVQYTVTASYTFITSSNSDKKVIQGNSYRATLTAVDGYYIKYVVITMGGNDITKTSYENGTINISSVTGNVVITAVAGESDKISNYTTFKIGTGIYASNGYEVSGATNRLSAYIGDITFNTGDVITVCDYEKYKFAIGTNKAGTSANNQLWINGGYNTADYTLTENDLADMKVLMVARVDNADITSSDIDYINTNAKVVR